MNHARLQRRRWPRWLIIILGCACGLTAPAQVTTRTDTVGKLLNLWNGEGSAAGLDGVFYENRDAGHSPLPVNEWPQLKVFTPSDEEKKTRPAAGPAALVRPLLLIGNCSMAAPADKGGSLPRFYFMEQGGYRFITNQYLANNLFIYPCHHDYSAGWNGTGGGWGDLYPANSPCLLISQGSSFTDQPFLRAFLSAMAALPPETKRVLVRTRMMMPALQALFRRSNRQVKSDEDYFTAAAHPPVFRGEDVDEEKFARLAHNLPLPAVPPVVLLRTKDEAATPKPGRDIFELAAAQSEKLGDTPCMIARVFRGSAMTREMNVSVDLSGDVERRPLQFRWVLLQGDPRRVKIVPLEDGSGAKITVAWHPEMMLPSSLATHRVDIGVFAFNGISWSAPSFITFYMLPNEARFYRPDGRIEEICYNAGNPDTGLPPADDPRWLGLGRRLEKNENTPGLKLLRQALPPKVARALMSAADQLAPRQDEKHELGKKPADAAGAELKAEIARRINAKVTGGGTVRDEVRRTLLTLADTPDLFVALQDQVATLARSSSAANATGEIAQACRRAVDARVLSESTPRRFALRFQPSALTAGERAQLRTLHLTVLACALLPELLERSQAPAWADPRLTIAKPWRDVYRYNKEGLCTGWTRIMDGGEIEFDEEGRMYPAGRNGRPVPVKYGLDAAHTGLQFTVE